MTRDEARVALGAYVLGALAAGERSEVERWLTADADLRDELARLAALPGLLGRLDADAIEGGLARTLSGGDDLGDADPAGSAASSSDDTAVERLVAAAATEQRAERRRLVVWRAAAAVAALLALTAGILAIVVSRDDPATVATAPPGPAVAVEVVDAAGLAAGMTGEVRANPRGWGAEVEVYLWDLPTAPTHFTMVVVASDGRQEQAAAWGTPPSGQCRVVGATSIPAADIARVDIVSDGGPVLATAELL
jgi:anti-sigma-K factor RskA